jgi:hypothetical protein
MFSVIVTDNIAGSQPTAPNASRAVPVRYAQSTIAFLMEAGAVSDHRLAAAGSGSHGAVVSANRATVGDARAHRALLRESSHHRTSAVIIRTSSNGASAMAT